MAKLKAAGCGWWQIAKGPRSGGFWRPGKGDLADAVSKFAAFHAADEQAERKVIALGSRTRQAHAKQARSSTANG
jgi:hypothetical protein